MNEYNKNELKDNELVKNEMTNQVSSTPSSRIVTVQAIKDEKLKLRN